MMRRYPAITAAVLGTGLLFTSACGGSSDSKSSTSDANAAAPAAASCDSLYGIGTGGKWAAPTDAVKPPAKKGLAVLIPTSAATEAANRPVRGMQAALTKLGWKSQVIDGKGTPSVYNTAIKTAINLHADAILTVGLNPGLVKNALAQARAAGIVVLSNAETGNPSVAATPPADGYQADVSADGAAMGKLMGQYMVCSTNKKIDLLPFNDGEYASSAAFIKSAVDEVKNCSSCKVEPTVEFSVTQVASNVPGQTVSYLRTHPDVTGVLTPYDPAATFQIPAMKAAKVVSKVKLYGEYGDSQNLDYIRTGQVQDATVAVAYELSGWATVDEMLRVIAKQPLVSESVPFALINKDHNMPAKGEEYSGGADYKTAFAKLWGV